MKKTLWFIVLLVSACIPAQAPLNLSATPGAAVVVTRDTYRNDLFSVEYPAGWRVITSPAGAPPSVTFVAPGNCGLVIVSSAALESVPLPASPLCDTGPAFNVDQRPVKLGNTVITVAASAPDVAWTVIHAEMARIAASLALVS